MNPSNQPGGSLPVPPLRGEAPLAGDAQAGEQVIDFLEYWRIVNEKKWLILGLAGAIALVALLVVFAMRPVFQGNVTLLIEAGRAKVVSIEEVYGASTQTREFFQTQAEILKSHELAKRVAGKLKLYEHPDFDITQESGFSLALLWPGNWFEDKQPPTLEQRIEAAARRLGAGIDITPVRNSQLIKVSVESYDRALAAKLANTLAESYIDMDLESKVQMTQKASSWLNERLTGLRKQLETSEQALQQYRERENIVDAKDVALSGAALQLGELTTRLVAARQRRAEAAAANDQIQAARRAGTSLESVPAIARNPQVAKFKETEGDMMRKVSELSQRYGREHPKMVAAQAELKAARDNIQRQMELAASSAQREYDAARAEEQAIAGALGQSKGDIRGMNRKEFQLGVLQREVDANRQLYDMFLSRIKQTDVSSDMQSTVARVIDPAIVPTGAAKPKKLLIVTFCFGLGLFLGAFLAVVLDRLDSTFKTSSDVESKLGMPLLGVAQLAPVEPGRQAGRLFLDESKSAFAEAIRTIRTGVMLSGLDDPKKILMVTSSVPQEGKSTMAMNLAFAIGHLKKVLLIDADMRRPSIGKALGVDAARPGLSNFVAGTAQIGECMAGIPGSNVHVMTAGLIPPNPLELLWSKKFAETLEHLSQAFDYIIIDTPPVQLVSDAFVIAKLANEVVYVVKADDTPYQVARTGIRRLQGMGAHVLGVVLNQLDIRKAERYYGEYGYRYGYTYYGGDKDDTGSSRESRKRAAA